MRSRDTERLDDHRRREVLRSAGGGLAAGALAATAGCLASMPTLGQQIRYEDVDVPEPDVPTYRKWIPAPSALEHADHEWTNVIYATPGEMGEDVVGVRSSLSDPLVKGHVDYLGVGYENYDHVVSTGSIIVGRGSFEASTVRETALESGYEPIGTYEGYDLFERTDLARGVAVRDGTVIFRRRAPAPGSVERADLEVAIDAGDGRIERRHQADDEFEAMTRAVGAYPEVQFFEGGGPVVRELSEEVAGHWSSMAYTFDEEGAYHRIGYLLEESVDVPARRVEEALRHENRALDAYAVDVTIDHPFLWVDMQESHADLRERVGGAETAYYPQITWGAEANDDGTRVTFSHDGGDPVDADLLTVHADSGSHHEPEIGPQFADEFDVVDSGAALTVEVPASEEYVALVYSPRGSNDAVVTVRVTLE